jgi:hypothetical protein
MSDFGEDDFGEEEFFDEPVDEVDDMLVGEEDAVIIPTTEYEQGTVY